VQFDFFSKALESPLQMQSEERAGFIPRLLRAGAVVLLCPSHGTAPRPAVGLGKTHLH